MLAYANLWGKVRSLDIQAIQATRLARICILRSVSAARTSIRTILFSKNVYKYISRQVNTEIRTVLVHMCTCLLVYLPTFPMNENSLKKALTKINLGALRYFDSIGSTNDEALAWAADDAKDLSIVIADEQTQGRGRLNRKWFTPKGSALAFSLILRPSARFAQHAHLSRTVGLAALSIAESCSRLGLAPALNWP